jgi:hypothetical protein
MSEYRQCHYLSSYFQGMRAAEFIDGYMTHCLPSLQSFSSAGINCLESRGVICSSKSSHPQTNRVQIEELLPLVETFKVVER